VRVSSEGHAIDVEVYRMPRAQVGDLLATVPPPLAIGTVSLLTGEDVHGFVCEPIGIAGARDISDCGGWRTYLSARSAQ
jgi:allophanate hydrolase